jgi:sensor histidine kinase YesM
MDDRSTLAARRSRRRLISRESLIAFVLGSPLVALTLSKDVLHGTWPVRARVIAGIFAYTGTIAISLYATFEGILSRLGFVKRSHPARLVAYGGAVVLVAAAATVVFEPLLGSTGIRTDPLRHMVQASVIVSVYLATMRQFKHMAERIADERNRTLAERSTALHARFQALQARTNPHFLFNSLNSVMSLIGKDPGLAELLLARLSTLLRYSVEGSEQRHVALRAELQAVRDYLEIEQVRFGPRLRVEICVDDDVDLAARIPPMVLQPLVENAVLHGVGPSVEGGRIEVRVSRGVDARIELTVDDDGRGSAPSLHVGTRTSLSNLEERLRIVYGAHATLTAGPRASGGFRARITVPRRLPGGAAP